MLIFSQALFAADLPIFSEFKDDKNHYILEYDVSARVLHFKHLRGIDKKQVKTRIFKVQTDEEVQTAEASVNSYLQEMEANDQNTEEFLSKLEELQHLNMSQCQVIHFHSRNPHGSTNFDNLLSEVERINALERMGPESFRSVPLFDIALEDEGDFQIRGVLDRTNHLVKLSIVRADGSIKDYSVKNENGEYRFISPKGELLFIVKPNLSHNQKGSILLMTPKSEGVENVHKTYFSLTQKDSRWDVKTFNSSPESSKAINGVPLIRFNVSHEPVYQVNDSDTFFKGIDEDELEGLIEKLGGNKVSLDYIQTKSRKAFAACMMDRVMEEKARNIQGKSNREVCLLVAEVEVSLEVQKIEAGNYFEKSLQDKVAINEMIKTLSEDFRVCLGQGEGFHLGKDYLIYNIEYLSKNIGTVEKKLSQCKDSFSSLMVKSLLTEEIRRDGEISDIIPAGNIFEGFLTQVLVQGYEKCLGSKGNKFVECKSFASLYKDTLVFSADISHRFWQKNERSEEGLKKHKDLVETYKSCISKIHQSYLNGRLELSSILGSQAHCSGKVVKGLGMKENAYDFSKIINSIDLFQDKKIVLSEEQSKLAKETYEECFSKAVKEIGTNSLEQFDSSKYLCAVEAAKKVIPDLYADQIAEEFGEYLWSPREEEALRKYAARLIKRRIGDLTDPSKINEALVNELPTVLAKALGGAIDSIMKGNFSDDENFVFNGQAQREIQKKLFFLIAGNSNKPLTYELKRFVLKEVEQEGIEGAKLRSSALLQDFVKVASPFIAVKEIGNEVFIKDDRDSLAKILDSDIQACLDEFKPKGEKSLKEVYKYCEKKRFSLKEFLISKRDFEILISHSFPLSTDAANRALSPIHYMKECIDGLDDKDLEVGDYEKMVGSCIKLTSIKISNNIDQEKIRKFKPYMKDHRGGGERYSGLTSAYCHKVLFVEVAKEIGDKNLTREILEDSGSYLTAGNTIYNDKLLEAVSHTDFLNESWFVEKLKKCRDGTHTFLMQGLKNHLVQMIPAINYNGVNRVGQSNKEVLESFLDAELLELVLRLKIHKGDKGGELNSAEDDPTQKVVTSTLTLDALSNFMKILGGYISDGFIYEKDKMKTELVIFREELKRALKWINGQARPIRIAELGDFFSESTFADHLAQAMVSEMVRDNFMSFIRDMELDELRASRQGSGYTQAEVKTKFRKLRGHTKTMTSYYDFSHIIRPKSTAGGRLLKLIKENHLLPKLIGDEVSSYTREKIKNDVANAILRDNTVGGFAELFVREIAELELSKKKSSHWAITRYFFYDSDDFDWDALRKTKAGKKAIEYYGKQILLPKMLGKSLTSYEEGLRMKRFKSILDDAISEND
ncbi:MAG: hypothetical protein ACJAT2_001513 [Bacteriovoracaceae bacterium]|jgi:hypothetical protein